VSFSFVRLGCPVSTRNFAPGSPSNDDRQLGRPTTSPFLSLLRRISLFQSSSLLFHLHRTRPVNPDRGLRFLHSFGSFSQVLKIVWCLLTNESCSLVSPDLPPVVNVRVGLVHLRSHAPIPQCHVCLPNQREPGQRPFALRGPEHAKPLRVP
jgi:hypothetical protein